MLETAAGSSGDDPPHPPSAYGRGFARLLRLLSMLEARRDWTGPQLAERLGVTTRTVRYDIERLRNLGYPVDAAPGVSGGYRLGMGAILPPLLLDDDEAVAVAIGLRTAAGGAVAGIEESSVRALAKLERLLPSRLRRRIGTLATTIVMLPGPGAPVDGRDADGDSGRLPGPRTAALRLPRPRRRGHRPGNRAASPGQFGTPLVPAGVGCRQAGLAYVPGRPDEPAAAGRAAVHPQADVGRGGGQPPVSRAGHGDLALPGAGNGCCPGRRDRGPAARRHHGGAGRAGRLRDRGRI